MASRLQSNKLPSGSDVSGKKPQDALRKTTSNVTDENDVPLAKPLPRQNIIGRLQPAWSSYKEGEWERGSAAKSAVDPNFMVDMLEGLYHRLPEKSSYVLKDRRPGTMTEYKEEKELPCRVEDVRLRHEHAERCLVEVPKVLDRISAEQERRCGLGIIKAAILSELRDLYTILSSMETRKYDLCCSDIRALFAWFKYLENFLRVYLTASEKMIYHGSAIESWATLHGKVSKEKRMKEKKRIVELSDRVEGLKRPMLALNTKSKHLMGKLHDRVDEFVVRVVGFLQEEAEQVPCLLESKLTGREMEQLFGGLVREIRGAENGRDMVIVMSRGVGGGTRARAEWVRQTCGGLTRMSAQAWMKKFGDRHSGYVGMFAEAEEEYRKVYRTLSTQVDERIAGVRDEVMERL